MPNIVEVIIKVKDDASAALKNHQTAVTGLGNVVKGFGGALAGSGLLSLGNPLAAAGVAMGAFAAVAIPTLTKVQAAQTALTTAQQAYAHATTNAQRVTALKAEQKATENLTGAEKAMMGPM